MEWVGKALRAAALAGLCAANAAAPVNAKQVDFGRARPSAEVREVVQWVAASGDHLGRPFVVVDKKQATVFVFDERVRLVGASPALLGLAPGDRGVPGLGKLPLSQIRPDQRITPAGRYASEPGRNLDGEHVVWFDYDEGLALHRLRPAPARENRPARLASATPRDNRISFGCVIVPVAFYESVVLKVLGQRRGVFYVLPETRPARELFGREASL